jgi:beta-lactam-binding protein with PASTA domain
MTVMAIMVIVVRWTNPMPVGAHVWRFGRFLLFMGALGATFLVSFGVSMRVALRAREVQVPNVVGRTVAEATASTGELGLGLRVDPNQRPSDRVPAGRVMQQEPQPGDVVRRQRTVRVWASSGPVVTVVPALAGQSERTARIRAAQENLSVSSVTEIRSGDYEPDVVVAQDPPPEARATNVAILLNRGEDALAYVMPDLIGMDAATAADHLRAQGFRVTINPAAANALTATGFPPGTVVRQQPSGGFRIPMSDPITLEASR